MTLPGAWVLYDGQCQLCTGWADRFGPCLRRNGFNLAALQTPWVEDRLHIPKEKLLDEMRVITEANQVLGGANAILYILKSIWYTRPLYALSLLPGVTPLLHRAYRTLAARRNCLNGACKREDH